MAAKPKSGRSVPYADLIGTTAILANVPQSKAREVADALFDSIQNSLRDGHDVKTPIGTFKRADRKSRMGRNPQTGEAVKIRAQNAAKFTAAKRLKDALNS